MNRFLFSIAFTLLNTMIWGQQYWTPAAITSNPLKGVPSRTTLPSEYGSFYLDENIFRVELLAAPEESEYKHNLHQIILPMPDGHFTAFAVYHSPVMEAEISARYPAIKSYKVIQKNNPSVTGRLAFGPDGFYGAISGPQGDIYIDPVVQADKPTFYISYFTKNDGSNPYEGMSLCGADFHRDNHNFFFNPSRNALNTEVERREYRLAMACTGEWGMRRNTVEKALSDMNVMVNRMNMIYERDMAIRFKLINDNDKLIFLNPETDPYTGSNMGRTILGQNTGVLNTAIGFGSYDVGHVLSVCFDIGGVAQGGSACQFNKGAGVTCHNDNNLNAIVVNVMAHEVGHQFDASHSWNSCPGSSDQYAPSWAFEPGSGTTIMSYAGACGSDNITNMSNDDYFHVGSLEQMYNKSNEGGNAYGCATKVTTNNRFPVITSIPASGLVIPVSTPFELNGLASDPDGDVMTYSWEQYDLGPQSTLGSPIGSAPSFRSLYPGIKATRFLPTQNNLIAGRLNEKDEVLPTITRPLKFRFTVRDNHPQGGGVVWEEVSLSATATAGPFKINYPVIDEKFKVGDVINVTWEVANTDKAPVNCKNVNIFLSVNAALEDSDPNMIPIALNVPNTGTARVVIPNVISNRLRFVIKAADNIFLTNSLLNSTIEAPLVPTIYTELTTGDYRDICLPESAQFNFRALAFGGLTDSIRFDVVSGLPDGAVVIFSKESVAPGEDTQLNIDLAGVKGSSYTEVIVRAYVPGVDTLDRIVRLNMTGTDLGDIALLTPVNGSGGFSVLPTYRWNSKTDADEYEVELATNPSFSANTLVNRITRLDTFVTSPTILDKATIHYWRVRSGNKCGYGEWSEVFAFNTEALSCKTYGSGIQSVNISASGMPAVEIGINIFDEGTANDVNVKMVRGEHNRVGDLVAFLVAPSGNEVLLWTRRCGTSRNFNVGVDDQSPDFFQCPINTGRIYRPESPLSALIGEEIKGTWKVRIEDRMAGEGGRFQEVNLELCSNIILDQPFIVRNDRLQLPPEDRAPVNDILLFVSDNNNTANQLIFTLVRVPALGSLEKNGLPMSAGDTFTQMDVNNGIIKYKNLAGETQDSFSFTVKDGEGGWIPITDFIIDIDPTFPSSVRDLSDKILMSLSPNPVKDLLTIYTDFGLGGLVQLEMMDSNGRMILNKSVHSGTIIEDVRPFEAGLYIVRLSQGNSVVSGRFIKL
jgi:subtilisin-like proprotein convertase family protein